jgi:hypothetical protein
MGPLSFSQNYLTRKIVRVLENFCEAKESMTPCGSPEGGTLWAVGALWANSLPK